MWCDFNLSLSVFLQSIKLRQQSYSYAGCVHLQTYTPQSCSIFKYNPRGQISMVVTSNGARWLAPHNLNIWSKLKVIFNNCADELQRGIRVILFVWQAVIKETIWQSLRFKWITAWFTLSAFGGIFLQHWVWWMRCMCSDRVFIKALVFASEVTLSLTLYCWRFKH